METGDHRILRVAVKHRARGRWRQWAYIPKWRKMMIQQRTRWLFPLVVLTLFFLGTTRFGFGQAVSGSIFGTVTDPSRASVPGAAVTIWDLDRGINYQLKTNPDANYIQTHLLAGHYRVTIEAPGFETFIADAVVEVDTATRVDARLVVGKAATTVSVTGETPILKTDRAELSETLSTNELAGLPVFDRNMTSLLLVMPGAYQDSFSVSNAENPQGGLQIDVNGQNFTANGFLLDGTSNQNPLLSIAIINPNLDSLQELKVTTSNYDAEFGAVAGALLQATTKSGTNQVHGSAFEYLQNNVLNSGNPFTGWRPPSAGTSSAARWAAHSRRTRFSCSGIIREPGSETADP